MITGFEDIDQNNDSLSKLKNVLFGNNLSYSITSNKNNKAGKSEGIIVGGNLTLIQSTIGSKTELKIKDKILFIEEIGEYAYHIDRMLHSLKRAGYFENCKGLIVGQISDVKKNTTDFGRSINEIILDVLDEYNFPILFDFPAGHEKTNFPIILGRKVILEVSKSKSKVIFYD
jgi:muramoyltetrapeptide carboxypeptidase